MASAVHNGALSFTCKPASMMLLSQRQPAARYGDLFATEITSLSGGAIPTHSVSENCHLLLNAHRHGTMLCSSLLVESSTS